MKNEKFPNGCGVLSLNDLDYEKIAADSLKERFDALPEETKAEYIEKHIVFGISMDAIKTNAMLRYAIERVKLYGTREKFIEANGEYAFNRFFVKEKGSQLDTRWETIEELINKGFD